MISARLAARPLLADGLLAAVVLAFQLWLEFGLYGVGRLVFHTVNNWPASRAGAGAPAQADGLTG